MNGPEETIRFSSIIFEGNLLPAILMTAPEIGKVIAAIK
jgi:hypothetical protein